MMLGVKQCHSIENIFDRAKALLLSRFSLIYKASFLRRYVRGHPVQCTVQEYMRAPIHKSLEVIGSRALEQHILLFEGN